MPVRSASCSMVSPLWWRSSRIRFAKAVMSGSTGWGGSGTESVQPSAAVCTVHLVASLSIFRKTGIKRGMSWHDSTLTCRLFVLHSGLYVRGVVTGITGNQRMREMNEWHQTIPRIATWHNPPGWPQPSHRWVLEHQGTLPSRGWKPVRDCPNAPVGWVFWTADGPDFNTTFATALSRAQRRVRNWTIVAIAGVVLSLVSALSGTAILFWGATIFGTINAFRSRKALRIQRTQLMESFGSLLADEREKRLAAEFEDRGRS